MAARRRRWKRGRFGCRSSLEVYRLPESISERSQSCGPSVLSPLPSASDEWVVQSKLMRMRGWGGRRRWFRICSGVEERREVRRKSNERAESAEAQRRARSCDNRHWLAQGSSVDTLLTSPHVCGMQHSGRKMRRTGRTGVSSQFGWSRSSNGDDKSSG